MKELQLESSHNGIVNTDKITSSPESFKTCQEMSNNIDSTNPKNCMAIPQSMQLGIDAVPVITYHKLFVFAEIF